MVIMQQTPANSNPGIYTLGRKNKRSGSVARKVQVIVQERTNKLKMLPQLQS